MLEKFMKSTEVAMQDAVLLRQELVNQAMARKGIDDTIVFCSCLDG